MSDYQCWIQGDEGNKVIVPTRSKNLLGPADIYRDPSHAAEIAAETLMRKCRDGDREYIVVEHGDKRHTFVVEREDTPQYRAEVVV